MARQPKPWYWTARKAWFVTIDGKRHTLGREKKAAHLRFHELMRKPIKRTVPCESVVAIADRFLEWVHKHRSPHTYEWYRHRLERFARKHPSLLIRDLRPFHVQEWVDDYPELKQTTKRNYMRTVKRCMKWALQQGYVSENPVEHLEVPGAERNETLITLHDFEALLSHCPDENFKDLVITTWETGCRPQESLRVEARHVDLANSRWLFPQQESKGKKAPRIVYLSEVALEITKRRMAEYPTGPLFRNSRGNAWTKDSANCAVDRVRTRMGKGEMQRRGITITADQIATFIPKLKQSRVVKGVELPKSHSQLRSEAKRKLNAECIVDLVPRYSLYKLRHAWATRALQSGLDGLTVAVLMGHSDPSTLARVYQHLSHDPTHLLNQARKAAG
ncbi:tyrosine-type recombinase/integrase [Fuerstiella marisgermanici]|uniref:Site-specific tyrosine recombinase n=1 Tax=Fuerstiella marisgermanici TaxID=1891926 RepID=A0A1P8WH88_9PLAN|nr:tyrosine-type recombinase/integrase [Fuerstiella marisgermanici]APZ93434.1 site-specific tyrosine recombinase [Fuerstiella marisgermanici]